MNRNLEMNKRLFVLLQRRCLCLQPQALEDNMQNGSVIRRTRKMHSDIWQFRWSEKTTNGKRVYRRKEIGTVDQFPSLEAARKAACLLVPELNVAKPRLYSGCMTVSQLCSHFEQRELCMANAWRSYSTKHIYQIYLRRWVVPKWSHYQLNDIKTISKLNPGSALFPLRGVAVRRSVTSCRCSSIMPAGTSSSIEIRDSARCAKVRKRKLIPVVLTANQIRILWKDSKPAKEHWSS